MRKPARPALSPAQAWGLAAAFLIPRLYFWWTSIGATYDIDSYRLVELDLHDGRGLYSDPALAGRYPYLPAWAWCLRAAGGVGRAWGLAPWKLFKLPILAAELGVLLGLLRLGGPQRLRAAFLWALSPLAVLVGAAHGQFDAIVLWGLLGAVVAIERGKRAGTWAGLAVGAALCFKHWPILLLPVLVRRLPRGQRAVFFAACAAVPLACVAPSLWQDGWAAVLKRLLYGGGPALGPMEVLATWGSGIFEPSRLASLAALWRHLAQALLGLAWLWSWWRPLRGSLAEELARQSLGILVLAPGLSVQYLLWPLPWLALAAPALGWIWSLGAGALALAYYHAHFPLALNSAWSDQAYGWAGGKAWALTWGSANLALWVFCAWMLWRVAARGPKRAAAGAPAARPLQ